jgi:hypothetical protein
VLGPPQHLYDRLHQSFGVELNQRAARSIEAEAILLLQDILMLAGFVRQLEEDLAGDVRGAGLVLQALTSGLHPLVPLSP